jgi:hypothetical protein
VHCRGENVNPEYTLIKYDNIGFGVYGTGAEEPVEGVVRPERDKQPERSQGKGECPLSAVERHEQVKRLIALGLSPEHRESLRKRGMTDEQIDKGGYFSVSPWMKVDIDSRFPGVKDDGTLLVAGKGIGIPVPDVDGHYVGLQVRLDNPDDGGKYRWVSSSKYYSAHINGEMPLGVYRSETVKFKGVPVLIEGHLKPNIACQLLGCVAIGAAGGNFASSPKQFKRIIEALHDPIENPHKLVLLYPDAGSVHNENVMRTYRKTADLLAIWGFKCKFVWWDQESKEDKDVDEFATVEHAKNKAVFESVWLDYERFFRLDELIYIRSLTPRKGHKVINQPWLTEALPETGLIMDKSPMGTGKTFRLRKEVAEVKARGERVLSLGYRNSLQLQMATDLGLTHIAEVEAGNGDKVRMINKETPYLALCVDSMMHLDIGAWKGCHIILDEVESVVEHLLNGSTCRANRAELLNRFATLIKGAKRVICADAGLTNSTVDYIEALRGEEATGVINNYRRTEEPRSVSWYGSCDRLMSKILEDAGNGVRMAIATDSQAEAEVIERLLLGLERRGKRIDSKTKNEPDIELLLARPNEELVKLRPDYLIYSPAIAAGVSFDADVFDAVYFVGRGVLAPASIMQMLGRVRRNVPWHISAPTQSMPDLSNPHEFVSEVLARWSWNAKADFGLVVGAFENWYLEGKGGIHTGFIQMVEEGRDYEWIKEGAEKERQRIKRQIEALWGAVTDTATAHHLAQARLKVKDNYERQRCYRTLCDSFEAMGCKWESESRDDDKKMQGRLEGTREELKMEAVQRIVESPDIEIEEAKKILKRDRALQKDREAAAKAMLKDRLPGVEITPELVLRCWVDKKGAWLKGVENQWLRQQDGVMSRRRFSDWQKLLSGATHPGAKAPYPTWQSDVKTRALKLKALEKLNIDRFLDPSNEFDATSPEVRDFHDTLRGSKNMQEILEVNAEDSPIAVLNQVLRKTLSLRLGSRMSNGTRIYSIKFAKDQHSPNDEMRLQILKSLEAAKQTQESDETT